MSEGRFGGVRGVSNMLSLLKERSQNREWRRPHCRKQLWGRRTRQCDLRSRLMSVRAPCLCLLLLLLLQCGGSDLAVRAAKPILGLMGKSVLHLGDAGAGQVAKICNNLVSCLGRVCVCVWMHLCGSGAVNSCICIACGSVAGVWSCFVWQSCCSC